jgi:hypothetical protein
MICNWYLNPLPEGYTVTIFTLSCIYFGHPYTLKNVSKALMSIELILQKQTCKTGPICMIFVHLLTIPASRHCTLLTGYGKSHACTPFLQRDRQIQISKSLHGTVLLEKLTVPQPAKKFPMFYRT